METLIQEKSRAVLTSSQKTTSRIFRYSFYVFIAFLIAPQISIAEPDCFMWGFSITWPEDLTRCPDFQHNDGEEEIKKIKEAIDRTAEIGGRWFRLHLVWADIEPEILEPYINFIGDIDDEMINQYLEEKNWSKYDEIVKYASSKGVNIIFVLGAGFVQHEWPMTIGWPMLPLLDGNPISIDTNSNIYFASLARYVRAAVKRYSNYVKVWQLENELNTAGYQTIITPWWRWRAGGSQSGWWRLDVQLRLLQIMRYAVKNEDEQAKVYTNFHSFRPDLIEAYSPYLDWIGLDIYWDQIFEPESILLFDLLQEVIFSYLGIYEWGDMPDVSKAISDAKDMSGDKPILLAEAGYNSLVENQAEMAYWIDESTKAAVNSGAIGYLHWTLSNSNDDTSNMVLVDGCTEKLAYDQYSTSIKGDIDDDPLSPILPDPNISTIESLNIDINEETTINFNVSNNGPMSGTHSYFSLSISDGLEIASVDCPLDMQYQINTVGDGVDLWKRVWEINNDNIEKSGIKDDSEQMHSLLDCWGQFAEGESKTISITVRGKASGPQWIRYRATFDKEYWHNDEFLWRDRVNFPEESTEFDEQGWPVNTISVQVGAALDPILQVSPLSLTFYAVENGPNPDSISFSITNRGEGPLNWSASWNASWIEDVNPSFGSVPSSPYVSVDIDGLPARQEEYTELITITALGASNSPLEIPVKLYVNSTQTIEPNYPTADTYITGECLNCNNGEESIIYAGSKPASIDFYRLYGLIRFNLSSIVGKEIISAKLRLYCAEVYGGSTMILLHRMSDPWDEDRTFFPVPSWSTAYASATVSSTGWKEWDVTNSVKVWASETEENNGFLIRSSTSSSYNGNYIGFGSSESANKPELIIETCESIPDLIVSQPRPNNGSSQGPFYIGQTIDWYVTVVNNGPGCAKDSSVGYYLENNPTDLNNRFESDSTNIIPAGEYTVEHDEYTFSDSDIGTKYLNVKADRRNEIAETFENNNTNYYGPFEVRRRPDFSITVDPTLRSIKQGADTHFNINLTSLNGFNSPVNLSLSNPPSGVEYSFSQNPVTPDGFSTLFISTNSSTTIDNYNLNIVGTSETFLGTVTHQTDATLEILDGIPPTVNIQNPTSDPSFITDNSTVIISGSANDGESGLANVSVNTDDMNTGTLENWSFTVDLTEGFNSIVVYARDNESNESSDSIVVYFDQNPPLTYGHSPEKGSDEVSVDTNVSFHIRDEGFGVDLTSVVITVEGEIVYDGNNPEAYLNVTVEGVTNDYSFVYAPPSNFGYGQVVDVIVDCQDLAGSPHIMPQELYSFITESKPDISVDPPSPDFGHIPVGSFSEQEFIVSNDGNDTLHVSSSSIMGDNPDDFSIVDGGGSFDLGPGDSHNITLRFSPTSTGIKNAILRISSDDPDEGEKDIGLIGEAIDLNEGLVAYYPFNGNANDESGNGNHGAVHGASLTADRLGIFNRSYGFDGVDDYIDCGNSVALNITEAISLTAWINARSLDGRIISKWGLDSGYELGIFSHDLRFSLNQTVRATASLSEMENQWVFICATWDGYYVRLYVNGSEIDSSIFSGTLATSPYNLVIGEMANFAPNYFNGIIDDVRIYNRALSEAEILQLFQLRTISYYFVNKSGDDVLGDGTVQNPWLTIQHAIDIVQGTETNPVAIHVAAGTYLENVVMDEWESIEGGWNSDFSQRWDFENDGLEPSSDYETIIDGEDHLNEVIIAANNCSIMGFTITNGNSGIYADGKSPLIMHNIIINNLTNGIYCRNNTALIRANKIENTILNQYNIAQGIYCVGSNTTIQGNIIINNQGDGISCSWAGWNPKIINNNIINNSRSGIYIFYNGQPLIFNNIISENEYGIKEGQIGNYTNPIPTVFYNDIYNNTKGAYYDIETGIHTTVTSMEENIPNTGNNIEVDPLFGADFHLQAGSPCINAGDPASAPPQFPADDIDGEGRPQGSGYDIGADEFYDSDGDDIPNYWEYKWFENLDQNDTTDWDSDGLTDLGEFQYMTDPTNWDTDNDDLPDGWEVNYGIDPLDSVGDNGRDGDLDSDHWTNYQEYVNGTDPNDPNSVPANNAPTAPALNYPVNDGETTSREPILSVSNSTDLDGHILSYTFEVYSDLGLSSLVTSVSGVQEGENTTVWQVDATLDDNSFYYWRARAYDGIDYSEWMDTAKFFVNTSNDAPSIPNISRPPDESEVPSLQPTLEVTNASDVDFDSLTYEFGLYSDENMDTLEISRASVPEGDTGTTSWQVNILLEDNTFYWWKAQARDNENEPSGWTDLFTFFVNTANDTPAAPSINRPQDGQEVDTLEPTLEVDNSPDADLDALTYFFEIDEVNTFDSSSLEQSPEVAEGVGNTTSWNPSQLDDNTTHYWRARAYDGAAYGQWSVGSFFVNLSNDAPSTPTINNPGDNSEVTTLTPTLAVNPSTDLDLDQITYDFELYSDANLSTLVTSTSDAGTSWQVDVSLMDNATYYWRARAVDEHGVTSDWSSPFSFIVNVNDQPTAPTLNNPVSGGTVTSLTPALSVNNSTDPDNDTLNYEFELYSDQNLSTEVASSTVSQGNLITSWTVSAALTDNTTYYWRVRVDDGELASSWMPTAVFVVNTSGADTIVEIEVSEDVSASAQATQTVEVTDDDSPISGVCVEIPPGALSDDCTMTIGVVTNPPALPANTKAIGKVIEFGPEGITFSTPVSIMIPYTQADLDSAGVSDPAELEVFTYDTLTLSWEKITIDSVDEVNSLLICNVDHFSMYTTGKSVTSVLTVTIPETATEGNGVLTGQGTVSIPGTLNNDLAVSLASSDTTEVTVPSTVRIFAGQTSTTFDLTIVDDTEIDGTQTVRLTASASGWTNGTDTIAIADNESQTQPDGCFIATTAYGFPMAKEVVVLRNFRDNALLQTSVGRSFVKFYHDISPPLADYMGEHDILRTTTRLALTPLVYGLMYPKTFLLIFLSSVIALTVALRVRRSKRF